MSDILKTKGKLKIMRDNFVDEYVAHKEHEISVIILRIYHF